MNALVPVPARRARLSPAVFEAVGYFIPRLLFGDPHIAPKLSWGDIVYALDGFDESCLDLGSALFWDRWREAWERRANTHLARAELARGVAARSLSLRRAAACLHWAEFMYFEDRQCKARLRERVRECFKQSLTFDGYRMTEYTFTVSGHPSASTYRYWVLTPARSRSEPWPCALLINGLDSITEVEVLTLGETFLRNGRAVILFEGPGQGLELGRSALRADMEMVIAQLLVALAQRRYLDLSDLGLLGVSFGGYLALRAAHALPDAFGWVVNFSGGPRVRSYQNLPRRLKQDFAYAFGITDLARMPELLDSLALPEGSRASPPILSVHGAFDDIFALADLRAAIASWGGHHRLEVLEGEAHVCLHELPECLDLIIDWISTLHTPEAQP
ncbi:alpha/beta hydrolase family protein [Pseudomonas sp. KNUC1026]|uniref:alpha/beta hydrolase family protein n=1 Tax=Pseudomonas sp. KNUC1026 TaxID=2893890 RepID=UPI001F33A67A|nr:prolyl oligopeptidase family serine peptidase [Pseudomonas sp. KNUC1026]UFH50206.1 prolyl oligopeptidase family serine peptidase [Pseudomonas sp. KNUC1026]